MKGFLTRMWEKNRLTEEKLRSYCPIFLTQAEVEEILALPQNGDAA